MAVSALSAARSLCEMRDWTVSNLELQKILYIAHMFHLGKTNGQPLIREGFEAWEYGPVIPEVYRHARGFGSSPVRNVFHWVPPVPPENEEFEMLKEASEATQDMSSGRLVSITHWPKGAWYKCYKSGARGITIPNRLILDEYHARTASR